MNSACPRKHSQYEDCDDDEVSSHFAPIIVEVRIKVDFVSQRQIYGHKYGIVCRRNQALTVVTASEKINAHMNKKNASV